MGLEDNVTAILEPEEMLPAGGQGAIGIEVKQDNDDLKSILNSIGCEKTTLCVSTERAVLLALGGSCHSPIGVNAILDDDAFFLRAVVCSLDGKHIYEEEYNGVIEPMDSLLKISYELGQTLKEKVPSEILEL